MTMMMALSVGGVGVLILALISELQRMSRPEGR